MGSAGRGLCGAPRGYGLTLAEISNAGVAPGFPEAHFHESRFAALPDVEEVSLAALLEETVPVEI